MNTTHVLPGKHCTATGGPELADLGSLTSISACLNRLSPESPPTPSATIGRYFNSVCSELPSSLEHTIGQICFKKLDVLKKLCEAPVFHRSVDDAIQTLIRRSTRLPDEAGIATLLLAQAIAERLLMAGIPIDAGAKSTTTETLIVALQHKCPDRAVTLATASVAAGVTLGPDTLLSTITLGVKSAFTPGDIAAVSKLATSSIQLGMIDLQSPSTVGVFDAFLGSCGEPGTTGSRISPSYRDRDILDSAVRLNALAPLVQVLVKNGTPFDTERTVDRVNMFVRALCSSALMLDIERVRLFEHLPYSELQDLKKATGLDTAWRPVASSRLNLYDPAPLSSSLVSAAISIVDLAIGHTRGVGQVLNPRYEINGSTINCLFNACFFNHTGLDSAKVSVLRTILDRALEIPRIRRKLHSAHIENGVLAILAAANGVTDPELLLMDSAAMLAAAIRSGFGFVGPRMKMVYERCLKSLGETNLSERWVEDAQFLNAKIHKLEHPPQRSSDDDVPKSDPTLLKGGLSSRDVLSMHSFGELAKVYRAA